MVATDAEQHIRGARAGLQVAPGRDQREVVGSGRQLDAGDHAEIADLEARADGNIAEPHGLAAGGGGGDRPVDARHDEVPVHAEQAGLDRGRHIMVPGGEMRMGAVVALVLVDGVIANIQGVGAGHGRRAVGQVVDRHPDAAAGAGLGTRVGAEGEEGEQRDPGGALGEGGEFHEGSVWGVPPTQVWLPAQATGRVDGRDGGEGMPRAGRTNRSPRR